MIDHEFTTGKGVVRDPNGEIVYRTDLPPGTWSIPDGHTVEEFDSFDQVLALDWPPKVSVSLSSGTITADGANSVTVTVEMVAESSRDWGTATLAIAGESFEIDVSAGTATQSLTTTTTDAVIPISVEHPEHGRDETELEVIQP